MIVLPFRDPIIERKISVSKLDRETAKRIKKEVFL